MSKAPFTIDPYLTGIAIGYKNPAYIADQVMPRVTVGKMDYKFTRYPIGEEFQVPNTLVGRRGEPRKIELTGTEDAGSCKDYGLEDSVPQSDIDQAPPNYKPLDRAVMKCTEYVALSREVRVATIVQATANYGANNRITLAGSDQFSDYDDSDPLGVITAGLDACVMRPNTIVMGRPAWSKLRGHPAIVKATNRNAGDAGLAAKQAIAEVFEVQNVLIGESFLNTAKPGQAPVISRVWGKDIALLFINPLADAESGITFGWTAEYGSRVAGQYPDMKVGLRGGVTVRSGETVDEKVIANDVGYLIKAAVA